MGDSGTIDAATRRLSLALDALEAAIERRHEADQSDHPWANSCMRSAATVRELAAELDEVTARSREVETTNREIARRIDVAMDGIRAVIDAQGR